MKKRSVGVIFLLFLFSVNIFFFIPKAYSDNTLHIKIVLTVDSDSMLVNGKEVKIDAPVEIKNGRTFVPLRAVVNAFPNTSVNYISDTKSVVVLFDGKCIGMQVDNVDVIINSSDILVIDTPPYIKNNRVMVPIRFVSEILGCNVTWVQETKQVIIDGELEWKEQNNN